MSSSRCCSSAGSCRCSGSNNFAFGMLLGVLGGAVGGWMFAQQRAARREPAGLRTWRRALVKSRGALAAGFLSARIQQRYDQLFADRPRFDDPALHDHLENNILPGLALYQVLSEENADRESVFTELDSLLEASMSSSGMAVQLNLLRRFSNPFAIFRFYITRTLEKQFPSSEWGWRWVEDSPNAVAFDATDCFYLRVLTAYGAPELTAHFCHLDDFLMSRFPYIAWKRTQTLARGDSLCNFRYEKLK